MKCPIHESWHRRGDLFSEHLRLASDPGTHTLLQEETRQSAGRRLASARQPTPRVWKNRQVQRDPGLNPLRLPGPHPGRRLQEPSKPGRSLAEMKRTLHLRCSRRPLNQSSCICVLQWCWRDLQPVSLLPPEETAPCTTPPTPQEAGPTAHLATRGLQAPPAPRD